MDLQFAILKQMASYLICNWGGAEMAFNTSIYYITYFLYSGNNLYGLELKQFLENLKHESSSSYILMDRIKPPGYLNCMIRANNNPQFCEVTSELGIYGAILG